MSASAWQGLQAEGVCAATISSILAEVDRDNNRRIDYDEFVRMMLSNERASRHSDSSEPGAVQHELPGGASCGQQSVDSALPHVSQLDSDARHTLHVGKSGAWLPATVRAGGTLA